MPLNVESLERLYQVMVRIRRFDEKTVELFNAGHVPPIATSGRRRWPRAPAPT